MKKMTILAILMVAAIVTFGFIQFTDDPSKDVAGPNDKVSYNPNIKIGEHHLSQTDNPNAVLYDRGQLVSHPGQGFGGADASSIQGVGTLYGFGNNLTLAYQMSDNFVIPAGVQWHIDSIKFFSYQTGSTTTSTLTGSSLRIVSGIGPDTTGSVNVYGDIVTSRMKSTYFTNIYRVTSTTLTGNTRPIMAVVDTCNVTLGPGSYWVTSGFTGSLASGPWAPPRTNADPNQLPGTARQKNPAGGWTTAMDGAVQMGLPFVIYGTVIPSVPTGTWTEQTSGLTSVLYSVSAVSDDVAWVCGAAGKVLRTTNKGVAWTNVSGTLPTAAALYNIFAWDANTAVVTGVTSTNTSIYQTSNGGTTWTVANTHAGFGDDMFMTDANTAYFIGDPAGGNWDLLKSTNAGLNWGTWATLPTTNTAGTYNNAYWQQGTQVWFPSVGQSQMLYSSNMGTNWATQTLTLSEITATCFNSPTLGMAAGSTTSPGLLKTTDAGTTWTALTSPYTVSISGIAGAQNSWWIAQQGLNISFSSNDGAAWTTQYTVAAGSFYHMTKSRSGATIWAVRSNGGISRYGAPIIGVNPISTETPSNYSVSQNYPNPFNPTTKINFALPKSGLVTLKVYDVVGKEVATLVNEVKNVGTYSVDFNASNLSSGIYFYKVSVNGFSEVKKMMLVK